MNYNFRKDQATATIDKNTWDGDTSVFMTSISYSMVVSCIGTVEDGKKLICELNYIKDEIADRSTKTVIQPIPFSCQNKERIHTSDKYIQ